MQEENKRKRVRLKYLDFLSSIFITFALFFLYLLGKFYVKFPFNQGKNSYIFSNLFEIQLYLRMISGVIFSLFYGFLSLIWSKDKLEQKRNDVNDLRSKILKIIKPNIIALIGIYSQWMYIRSSYFLIFLIYATYFASSCLLEIIIDLINRYGICNGFSLILFTEIIPTN